MPRWLKVVTWVLVIAVSVVVLFTVVFPRVERILEDPTMGHAPSGDVAPAAGGGVAAAAADG